MLNFSFCNLKTTIFLILLTLPNLIVANDNFCENKLVRSPIVGFSIENAHPVYLSVLQVTGFESPNLGTGGKLFCYGEEKIAIYKIYPTGAIELVYISKQSSYKPKNIDCSSFIN